MLLSDFITEILFWWSNIEAYGLKWDTVHPTHVEIMFYTL